MPSHVRELQGQALSIITQPADPTKSINPPAPACPTCISGTDPVVSAGVEFQAILHDAL